MELLFSGKSRDAGQADVSADGPVPLRRRPRADALAGLALALLATLTSVGIAVLSGWQRGGAVAEKIVCVALGVVAVLGVHLLPALARGTERVARGGAVVLCIASLAVVLYGQAEFFLFAQQHAGAGRADAVPSPVRLSVSAAASTRNLAVIAEDEETVRDALARIDARRCDVSCAWLHMRHDLLTAKLDSLATEAREAKRQEDEHDRQTAMADRAARLRDSLRADPVTARLTAVTGIDKANLDLLIALFCAGVLDGLGSLCWYLTAAHGRTGAVTGVGPVVTMSDSGRRETMPTVEAPPRASERLVSEDADERLSQLLHAVATGSLRPTVDGIRQHFRCAQKTANELYRQYHALRLAIQADGSKN